MGNETVSKINHIDTTDSLRRLEYIELLIGTLSFTEHFTYKTPASGRGNASLVVASISYKKDGNVQYTHHFTYDELGNIKEISIKDGSQVPVEIENYQYVYDGFNRLIRENIKTINYEQTIVYTYDDYSDYTISYVDTNTDDNRGNITSIERYTYTTGTLLATPISETKLFYKTTGWKDQITRVEEHVGGTLQKTSTYAYDSIGNITSITSDSNQSFDFEGRRLVEHTIGGVTYTYTYNDQGIRTSKSNGTTTTEYFLDGSSVLFEKTGNDVIYYTYDVDGTILSMNYNGDEYFYIKNFQGDIIEIVDATGTSVAKYRYDAWGNIVYLWDAGLGIADINPYRYRSYRYDTETGLYYLNSRYYDSSIGRFISADSINYLDPSSEQGLNLYAYGNNNPVMMVDSTGTFSIFALAKVLKVVATLAIFILVVVAVVVTVALIVGPTKEEHYNRNQHNDDLPSSVEIAETSGWEEESARYHQNNTIGGKNIKYISDDGLREVIFYNDGETINNTPEDIGTYNFASPKKDPVGHFFKDMVPYYLWGNSKDDTTNIFDRLFGH